MDHLMSLDFNNVIVRRVWVSFDFTLFLNTLLDNLQKPW